MNTWQGIALAALLLTTAQAQAEDTVHYYYTDPQGTVLAKADAAGNVVASYDYAPYGSQAMGAPPSGGPTGYTGHVNDADTGLVYMQARYYDPEVGRFLSVDPVGVGAGDAFNFNRFTYANNNPIVNDDPTGRAICSASGGGGCEKIKEQKMARDRAEQGSIEAQAPGSSAFMQLGAGYAPTGSSSTTPGAEFLQKTGHTLNRGLHWIRERSSVSAHAGAAFGPGIEGAATKQVGSAPDSVSGNFVVGEGGYLGATFDFRIFSWGREASHGSAGKVVIDPSSYIHIKLGALVSGGINVDLSPHGGSITVSAGVGVGESVLVKPPVTLGGEIPIQ